MREINLNSIVKTETDTSRKPKFTKLEIPIEFCDGETVSNKQGAAAELSSCSVVPNSLNSTCQIHYTYMPSTANSVQLIASLQGPTEAKFASKQDASRATIEVIVKCPNTESVEPTGEYRRQQGELRQGVKSVLEQIV